MNSLAEMPEGVKLLGQYDTDGHDWATASYDLFNGERLVVVQNVFDVTNIVPWADDVVKPIESQWKDNPLAELATDTTQDSVNWNSRIMIVNPIAPVHTWDRRSFDHRSPMGHVLFLLPTENGCMYGYQDGGYQNWNPNFYMNTPLGKEVVESKVKQKIKDRNFWGQQIYTVLGGLATELDIEDAKFDFREVDPDDAVKVVMEDEELYSKVVTNIVSGRRAYHEARLAGMAVSFGLRPAALLDLADMLIAYSQKNGVLTTRINKGLL